MVKTGRNRPLNKTMSVTHISNIAEFEEHFAQHQTESVLIAIFKGTKDPVTGASWCDDCDAAEPFLTPAMGSTIHENVLVCEIGPRESWKDCPDNAFRTHPKTRLRCVPTLIRYHHGSEVLRLEEAQLQDLTILTEIFNT